MNNCNELPDLNSKTVSRSLIDILISGAENSGLDLKIIERKLKPSGEELAWTDRVPIFEYLKLWQVVIDLTGEPALGLRIGNASSPDIGILGSLVLHCATLREVLQQICRFQNFMSDALVMSLEDKNGYATLHCLTPNAKQYCAQVVDQGCAFLISWSRQFSKMQLVPVEVRLRHAEPDYIDEYQQVFQAPVLFGQPECTILFQSEQLDILIPDHNPVLKDFIHPGMIKPVEYQTFKGGIREEVNSLIAEHLPMGRIGIDLIAQSLQMSRQTLHRKLKAEGTTFLELLENERKIRATNYLRQNILPVSDIAILLGFAESKSFRRAFNRWYGMSPHQYREIL